MSQSHAIDSFFSQTAVTQPPPSRAKRLHREAQQARIDGFELAIAAIVKPGMKVAELGAGTGVLAFFAAEAGAAKVWSVDPISHIAVAAQAFIDDSDMGEIVEIVAGDIDTWLPPEPVDAVICEMLHTAMVRERQLQVIASFKDRYLAKFGGPLPRFIPEAAVLAVQPAYTNFDVRAYPAAPPMFVDATNQTKVTNLARPAIYSMFTYEANYSCRFEIDHELMMEQNGLLNSLRFITKNLLAIMEEEGRSIDWDMPDLVVALAHPIVVSAGDMIRFRFRYDAGGTLLALAESIDGTEES